MNHFTSIAQKFWRQIRNVLQLSILQNTMSDGFSPIFLYQNFYEYIANSALTYKCKLFNSPSLTDRVSKREMQIYISIHIFHSKLPNFVSACWNSNLSNLLIQINGI